MEVAVRVLTFEKKGNQTMLEWHELEPSKKAPGDSVTFGESRLEKLEQLDGLLVTLGAS